MVFGRAGVVGSNSSQGFAEIEHTIAGKDLVQPEPSLTVVGWRWQDRKDLSG